MWLKVEAFRSPLCNIVLMNLALGKVLFVTLTLTEFPSSSYAAGNNLFKGNFAFPRRLSNLLLHVPSIIGYLLAVDDSGGQSLIVKILSGDSFGSASQVSPVSAPFIIRKLVFSLLLYRNWSMSRFGSIAALRSECAEFSTVSEDTRNPVMCKMGMSFMIFGDL